MQQIFKKIPTSITILLLAILIVASILSLWVQGGEHVAKWGFPLAVLVLLASLGLAYTAGLAMHSYYGKINKVVDDMQADRKRLQQQVALGNSDLDKQKAMLLAFQEQNYQEAIVALAADFMNVDYAAFLQLDAEGEVLECIQASSREKHMVQRGTKWKKADYPIFFKLIEEGKPIIYPDHMAVHRDYRPSLGNLLHYIENNNVRSLLIVPTGAANGTMGVVWFEDREEVKKWDERTMRQAGFIAGIVHLQLVQELQQSMIHELSTGLSRLEILRDYTSQGWAWYELPVTELHKNAAAIKRLGTAIPIEQNPQFIALAPNKYAYRPLGEWFPQEGLQHLVSNKYTMANYEWSYEGEIYLSSAFGLSDGGMLKGLWLSLDNITAQRSQEQLQTKIMAHLSNIVTEVDIDNMVVFDSPTVARLDFTTKERVGTAIPSYLHYQDVEKFELALWKSRREKVSSTCPYLRLRKNTGGYIHFDAKIYPAAEDGHLTIEFVEAATRAEEQQKMQEAQDFLKRLLAHSHELVAVVDSNDRLSYMSDNLEALFGYKQEERLGRYALEYFHQQDVPKMIRALERLQAGELKQYRQEASFLHRNGKWRKVQAAMHGIYHQDKLTAIALRVEDISEERKDIDLLRNREQLFATFMSRSSKSFWLLGPKGQLRYSTANISQLLGFEPQELIGKPIAPLLKAEEVQVMERNLQDWDHDPEGRSTVFMTIRQKDGTWKSIGISYLGKVENEHYSGLLLALEEPLGKQVIDSQIDLRADFFQAMANVLPMPMLFLDQAMSIKYANIAVKDWLGFTPSGSATTVLDAKSIQLIAEDDTENSWIQVRVKDKKGAFWQVKAQLFVLKGSVVKGKVLLIPPQTEEFKALEAKLLATEGQIKEVLANKLKLEGQIRLWEQEHAQLKDAEETASKAHHSEVAYLNDRIDLVQSALVSKNAEILTLETKLQMLGELKDRGKVLKKHFEDLRELLYMFDDIGREVDWQAKWQEIQHFKQLINYEQALKETRQFIVDTQTLLSDVTSESNSNAVG